MGNQIAMPGVDEEKHSAVRPGPRQPKLDIDRTALACPHLVDYGKTEEELSLEGVTSLHLYASKTLTFNCMLPEAEVWLLIAGVLVALVALRTLSLKHGNVSPLTIYGSPQICWRLATPPQTRPEKRRWKTALKGRSPIFKPSAAFKKRVKEAKAGCWDADLYSLCLCVLHALYPFAPDELSSPLGIDALRPRMEYVGGFYSEYLYRFLDTCIWVESKDVVRLDYAIDFVRVLQLKV